MKAKRNVRERTWSTAAQAVIAAAGVQGLEAAMPYLQGGQYAVAGKVLVFTIAMGVLAWLKNMVQNQLPDRKLSTDTED